MICRCCAWLLTFVADGVGVQGQAGGPVAPQLVPEGCDPPADVLVRRGLQEQSHFLSRQTAEAAHPGRGRRLQPVPDQELQDAVLLQVELGPVELLRGFDAGRDEARAAAAAAGPQGHRGQARGQAEAQGSFGVQPVQGALRAVQGDLLHAALLLGQTTVEQDGGRPGYFSGSCSNWTSSRVLIQLQ